MKIDKAIVSSNCDPFYLDFWPSISKVWRKKFNITPVLFLVHDDKSVNVSEEYGEVIYFDPLPNIPLHIQAQCSRYWLPITELETTWITSDIDMFPMSKKYFIDSITNIQDDKFVHLNANKIGAFPCCYNVAKGKTFKEVLNLPNSYEEYLKNIGWESFPFDHNNGDKYFASWGIDESYPNKMCLQYHDKNRFILASRHDRPGGECHAAYRIDRQGNPGFTWNPNLVLSDHYIDAHSIRPYSKHKNKIDELVELLIKNK